VSPARDQRYRQEMRELDVGAIPVAADGKLVSMVTDRDTIRCVRTVRHVKVRPRRDESGVVYCRDNEDVEDAVASWRESRSKLPVLTSDADVAWSVSATSRTRCARHHRYQGVSAHHG